MWKQQRLQHSPQARAALAANMRGEASPFNLSATGVKIGAHNWTHGIEERSNKYLSPENAVKVFVKKLTDYADPNLPKGEQDIVCVMVTAQEIDSFIATIENVAVLLPEPVFKQACDYAKSSKSLNDTKMVKTPQITSPAFAKEADITPQSSRMLQSIMRNSASAAQSGVAGDPLAKIEALKAVKARREAENQQKVEKLLNAQATVYGFSAHGEPAQIALELEKNLPNGTHIFTACVCFIGKDLNTIRGMLNDTL